MTGLKLRILEAGSCMHPEHIVLSTGSLRGLRFPALYAVIEHPREGLSLFDTGYSQHFIEATRPFPERLYAWVTPVKITPETSAAAQLARLGYAPSDVRQIFISHFHADHISGLSDFPRARFRFWPGAYEAVRELGRLNALRKGILPALLPRDFLARSQVFGEARAQQLPPACAPFSEGYDVFGDGSCYAVELPGHARGQLGLFVRPEDGRWYFLVADACWTRAAFERGARPQPITHLLFDDSRQYYDTISRIATLHRREQDMIIVPSHCEQTVERLRALGITA